MAVIKSIHFRPALVSKCSEKVLALLLRGRSGDDPAKDEKEEERRKFNLSTAKDLLNFYSCITVGFLSFSIKLVTEWIDLCKGIGLDHVAARIVTVLKNVEKWGWYNLANISVSFDC